MHQTTQNSTTTHTQQPHIHITQPCSTIVYDNMLVHVLEVFDKSMTRNNECFQESMKLQASDSRDQFLSNAKNCNGKSPKDLKCLA